MVEDVDPEHRQVVVEDYLFQANRTLADIAAQSREQQDRAHLACEMSLTSASSPNPSRWRIARAVVSVAF